MPRLFALDRNFPQPIVGVLSDFQADATLIPLDRIDPRLSKPIIHPKVEPPTFWFDCPPPPSISTESRVVV